MLETEREKMIELDDAAEEAGGYVVNMINKDTHYDLRKIIEYCKEKNIEPIDLTLRELNKFIM